MWIATRCVSHQSLLTQREGRYLAGLDTTELDEEITRRVLLQPQRWPGLFDAMASTGIITALRREQQSDLERVEDEIVDPGTEAFFISLYRMRGFRPLVTDRPLQIATLGRRIYMQSN